MVGSTEVKMAPSISIVLQNSHDVDSLGIGELTEPAIPLYHSFPIIKMRLGTRVFKMADEKSFQPLESKIALARRELNNLRSDMYSMKKMFAQKFKEIKEMVETGEVPN